MRAGGGFDQLNRRDDFREGVFAAVQLLVRRPLDGGRSRRLAGEEVQADLDRVCRRDELRVRTFDQHVSVRADQCARGRNHAVAIRVKQISPRRRRVGRGLRHHAGRHTGARHRREERQHLGRHRRGAPVRQAFLQARPSGEHGAHGVGLRRSCEDGGQHLRQWMRAVEHPLHFPAAGKECAESDHPALALQQRVQEIGMARRCHRHDPAPPVPDEMHAAALVFQPVADGGADLCFDRRQRLPPVVVEGIDLVERVERIDQRPVDGRDDAVGLAPSPPGTRGGAGHRPQAPRRRPTRVRQHPAGASRTRRARGRRAVSSARGSRLRGARVAGGRPGRRASRSLRHRSARSTSW